MGVRFACQACGKRLNVKSELQGKRGICPTCGSRFVVPRQDEQLGAADESEPAVVPPPPTSGAPRLIAESPDAVWYVRPPSGGQYGPASSALMSQWIAEGRITPDALIWRDGWPQWREAGKSLTELSATGVASVASTTSQAVEPVNQAGPRSSAGSSIHGLNPAGAERSLQTPRRDETTLSGTASVATGRRARETRRIAFVGILTAVSIGLIFALAVIASRS